MMPKIVDTLINGDEDDENEEHQIGLIKLTITNLTRRL
uniref:Uncharacterized protein n=1 Tax=Tetranychus urticae TaxID=32264 RepID=T1KKC0_TETUR